MGRGLGPEAAGDASGADRAFSPTPLRRQTGGYGKNTLFLEGVCAFAFLSERRCHRLRFRAGGDQWPA